MIIDSHAHLNYPELFERLDAVIENAKSVDVNKIITISTKISDLNQIYNIVDKYPDIINYTVGIHPDYASEDFAKYSEDEITSFFLNRNDFVGIGETGLDYHTTRDFIDIQKKNFIFHINFAINCNKVLVLHTREAEDDTYDILKSHSDLKKVIVHCFSGSLDFAKKMLDLGYYISFSGIVTFKSANEVREVAKYTPMDRILIETDAPFLAPVPYRGKVNEPSYVKQTGELVAKLKNIDEEMFFNSVYKNFQKIFFS